MLVLALATLAGLVAARPQSDLPERGNDSVSLSSNRLGRTPYIPSGLWIEWEHLGAPVDTHDMLLGVINALSIITSRPLNEIVPEYISVASLNCPNTAVMAFTNFNGQTSVRDLAGALYAATREIVFNGQGDSIGFTLERKKRVIGRGVIKRRPSAMGKHDSPANETSSDTSSRLLRSTNDTGNAWSLNGSALAEGELYTLTVLEPRRFIEPFSCYIIVVDSLMRLAYLPSAPEIFSSFYILNTLSGTFMTVVPQKSKEGSLLDTTKARGGLQYLAEQLYRTRVFVTVTVAIGRSIPTHPGVLFEGELFLDLQSHWIDDLKADRMANASSDATFVSVGVTPSSSSSVVQTS